MEERKRRGEEVSSPVEWRRPSESERERLTENGHSSIDFSLKREERRTDRSGMNESEREEETRLTRSFFSRAGLSEKTIS